MSDDLTAAAREEGRRLGDEIADLPRVGGDLPTPPLSDAMEVQASYAESKLPTLGEDEDILPMTDFYGPRGVATTVHEEEDDDQRGAVHGGLLPEVAGGWDARLFTEIRTVWTLPHDTPLARLLTVTQPSLEPDRVEAVVIVGSDGIAVERWLRRFERRAGEARWTDGEWRKARGTADELAPMVAPLVDALAYGRMARAVRVWTFSRPDEWWTPERLAAMQVAAESVEAGGDTRRGQRETAMERLEPLTRTFVALGAFVLKPDGEYELADEVAALAADPGLWEMPLALDVEERLL